MGPGAARLDAFGYERIGWDNFEGPWIRKGSFCGKKPQIGSSVPPRQETVANRGLDFEIERDRARVSMRIAVLDPKNFELNALRASDLAAVAGNRAWPLTTRSREANNTEL
jgi:hypothetical protein